MKRKKYDKTIREIDESDLLEPIKEQLKINFTKIYRRENEVEGLD